MSIRNCGDAYKTQELGAQTRHEQEEQQVPTKALPVAPNIVRNREQEFRDGHKNLMTPGAETQTSDSAGIRTEPLDYDKRKMPDSLRLGYSGL